MVGFYVDEVLLSPSQLQARWLHSGATQWEGSPSVDTGTSNREDTVRCRDSLAFVLNPDPLNGQHKKKCSAPGAPEEEDARWARMWELQAAGDFQGLRPPFFFSITLEPRVE